MESGANVSVTVKLEAKGKDRLEIEFFGKFVLCSNNEDNPVIIDHGETRYTSYRPSGDGTLFGEPRTGRPYSVSRSFVEEKLLFCNGEE